jgi:hypothetical protein
VPATVHLPAAAAEPGNAHAMPAAIVGPSVIPAFKPAVTRDPPERERIVAMLAAVQEDGGRTPSTPEHHQRTVHERDGEGSTAELRRPGHRIPPATRKGHGVRPGIHQPMMPVRQRGPNERGPRPGAQVLHVALLERVGAGLAAARPAARLSKGPGRAGGAATSKCAWALVID